MPILLLLLAIAAATILASLSLDLDTLVMALVMFGAVAALGASSGERKANPLPDETLMERRDPRAQAGGGPHRGLEFLRL